MTRQSISSDRLPRIAAPFSPAVRAKDLLFLSGQVGQEPQAGMRIDGDVAAQTRQIFANLRSLLEAADRTLDDVVKANVYLTDMADYAAMNDVYGKEFSAPYPARTCVAVTALPLGAQVEIEVVVQC
ncbi:MAG: RidA family protein [Rhizomicrobium sp.]